MRQKSNKVLMLVENLSVPADPRVWREACTLRQYGYQVSIICPKGEARDQESYVCIDGIHVYRYALSTTIRRTSDYMKEYTTAMLKTFGLSITVWRKHGFDVLHAANPPDTFFIIGLFYRLLGKKYIFDQHDLAPEVFHVRFQNRMKPLYSLLKFLERCSYQTANLVITTNESQKRTALVRGHCRRGKVVVVRNGPDIDKFVPSTPEPVLKRGKRHMLAYIGVMGVQDGVEYALQALHELVYKRGREDVLLVLMGDGDQFESLKAQAHQLGLDEYTHFTGWIAREDLMRYLTVADIGLCPDPSNELNDRSTMLKTMEYMAMSLPVVAFDLPETRYSAQDAALYAAPNRVESFVDHIEMLLDDADLRHEMGTRGRARVENELCWDRTQLNLWYAYRQLLPITDSLPGSDTGPSSGSGKMEKVTIS
jgi:glycosyltransferase involved in cell wall biosynthesis